MGAMVKVKCINAFHELETNEVRYPGDVFNLSREKAESLAKDGFVEKINTKLNTKEEKQFE